MALTRNLYQHNSSWNAPYTFSGKEKDAETGYGYFSARYYDSGLSIWLSVDPMSDKYPSMSPYNYCANNPVILVDPDGNSPEPCINYAFKLRLKGGFGSNGFNFNFTASVGVEYKTSHFQAVSFASASVYAGQQFGTSYMTRGLQYDVTSGAYLSGGCGTGSPHNFYTLNFNTPSPFNNTFKWSFSYGQFLTYNSAINAFGDGHGIQSQGFGGLRLGPNFSFSTNNDSRKYGSNLIFNRGKTIDAGWSGGIVVTLFDVQFGYQNFTGYWPEFENTEKYKYGDIFSAESREWGNGAYHQSLNRAFNFFDIDNKTVGMYSDAWMQIGIHFITNNGTYIYNNKGDVNGTVNTGN